MSEVNCVCGLRRETAQNPRKIGCFNRAIDVQPPALAGNLRRKAEVEGWPVPWSDACPGGKRLLLGP